MRGRIRLRRRGEVFGPPSPEPQPIVLDDCLSDLGSVRAKED